MSMPLAELHVLYPEACSMEASYNEAATLPAYICGHGHMIRQVPNSNCLKKQGKDTPMPKICRRAQQDKEEPSVRLVLNI